MAWGAPKCWAESTHTPHNTCCGAAGAITGGSGSNGITSGNVIRQLRSLKKNKNVAAVVLRIDSPGGDALASDLMWREIVELGKSKPVISSMSDVSASGGYYMVSNGVCVCVQRAGAIFGIVLARSRARPRPGLLVSGTITGLISVCSEWV